jgi:hypothetical protein
MLVVKAWQYKEPNIEKQIFLMLDFLRNPKSDHIEHCGQVKQFTRLPAPEHVEQC